MVRIHLLRACFPFWDGEECVLDVSNICTTLISVRGLVVMIVACQVMDPGSIPGERNFFLLLSFGQPLTKYCASYGVRTHASFETGA